MQMNASYHVFVSVPEAEEQYKYFESFIGATWQVEFIKTQELNGYQHYECILSQEPVILEEVDAYL